MNNKRESSNIKYSYYIEGQIEEWFIKNLKTELLKIKNKSICKKHTIIQDGACSEKGLKSILKPKIVVLLLLFLMMKIIINKRLAITLILVRI